MFFITRYCNQVLDKDIDDCATTLLQDLVRFQDRMYHKDPSKVTLPQSFRDLSEPSLQWGRIS